MRVAQEGELVMAVDGGGGAPSVPLLPLLSRDPQQLGEFRLLGRLGSGGMGTAFLGQGPSGWVVVKESHASVGSDPVLRARLQREVAAMRQAAGPFTAAVVDADLDAEVPWVAMEFVPGETLARTIAATGPLSPSEVAGLARGLIAGLAFLHERGVVHRDLKPSNIMLSPSGPRLIDLGIAEVDEATQLTRTGSIMGSTGWLAPEQIRGDGVGPATDVHAWALCVVYAASGTPPFGGDTSGAAVYRVLETTPDLPASVKPPLSRIISQALNKDPGSRPTAVAIANDLGGIDTVGFTPKRAPIAQVAVTAAPRTLQPTERGEIIVHVLGEVIRPGVVRLPPGSRVQDAINAAGGAHRLPALDSINLARILADGEQIVVGARSDSDIPRGTTSQHSPVESQHYRVGDPGPGGGTIFFDAGSPQSWGRYLEVAPASWMPEANDPLVEWCEQPFRKYRVSTRVAIGAGSQNTQAIVLTCGVGAAFLASEYRGGGRDDWYLPSKDELDKLFWQKEILDIIHLDGDAFYWSSSDAVHPRGFAWGQDFSDGFQFTDEKQLNGRVRPIRVADF